MGGAPLSYDVPFSKGGGGGAGLSTDGLRVLVDWVGVAWVWSDGLYLYPATLMQMYRLLSFLKKG